MHKNNMQENNLQQITCRIPSEGDVLRESACEDRQRAATNPNTPRARSGPVRISVAYGNIPAPGRRKEKNPKWSVSSDRVWVPRGSGCCERKGLQYLKNKQKKLIMKLNILEVDTDKVQGLLKFQVMKYQ